MLLCEDVASTRLSQDFAGELDGAMWRCCCGDVAEDPQLCLSSPAKSSHTAASAAPSSPKQRSSLSLVDPQQHPHTAASAAPSNPQQNPHTAW